MKRKLIMIGLAVLLCGGVGCKSQNISGSDDSAGLGSATRTSGSSSKRSNDTNLKPIKSTDGVTYTFSDNK